MKKLRISLLLLLSMVLLATGIYAEKAPLQLSLWHMEARPTRMKAIEDLINKFNHENPDLNVKVEVQSWGDVYVKAIAAIQANKYPDFIFSIPDFSMNMMLTRTVRPVDDIMKGLMKEYKIYQAATDPYYYDKHYWGVPLYGQAEMLWYRKDLFQKAGLDPNKPPKTWSQWLAACKTLVDKGVVKYPIAVPADWHLATVQQVYPLMVVNKAETIIDGKGKVVFDNPKTVETYRMYKKLFDMSPPGSASWQWDQPVTAFMNGEVAMVVEKGQYIEQWDLRTTLDPKLLGAAPIPVPDQGGQRGTSYYSNAINLLKSDPKVRAAYKRLVEFIYQPDNMGSLLIGSPGLFLPVTQEASKSSVLLNNATIKRHQANFELMVEESKYGKLYGFTVRPYNPNIGRITGQNLISWTAQRMIYDKLSPEEAVKAGAAKMKEAIE